MQHTLRIITTGIILTGYTVSASNPFRQNTIHPHSTLPQHPSPSSTSPGFLLHHQDDQSPSFVQKEVNRILDDRSMRPKEKEYRVNMLLQDHGGMQLPPPMIQPLPPWYATLPPSYQQVMEQKQKEKEKEKEMYSSPPPRSYTPLSSVHSSNTMGLPRVSVFDVNALHSPSSLSSSSDTVVSDSGFVPSGGRVSILKHHFESSSSSSSIPSPVPSSPVPFQSNSQRSSPEISELSGLVPPLHAIHPPPRNPAFMSTVAPYSIGTFLQLPENQLSPEDIEREIKKQAKRLTQYHTHISHAVLHQTITPEQGQQAMQQLEQDLNVLQHVAEEHHVKPKELAKLREQWHREWQRAINGLYALGVQVHQAFWGAPRSSSSSSSPPQSFSEKPNSF